MCLKYDVDRMIEKKDFTLKTPYFNACMIGYALGIVATYIAMIVMKNLYF